MATVEIYQAGTRIASKEFRTDFMIVADALDRDEIRWEADEESAAERGGVILAWIKAGECPPEIHFVPPGWSLSIDGKLVLGTSNIEESRFDVPVVGKVAELQHGNMLFVIRFSS